MLEVGNGGMSETEYRSHFTLWAELAAPLIAGNDLETMPAAIKAILTNHEVIAAKIRDLWQGKDLPPAKDKITATVESHGVIMLRIGA